MATPLFERIGKSIAKAGPTTPAKVDPEATEDDDMDSSPGAQLAEALGLTDVDTAAVDAVLRAAIRKLT